MNQTVDSSESSIEIFLRVRPSLRKPGYFQVDDIDTNRINFRLPLHSEHDVVNNSRTHYGFQFNGILDQNADQDDVFRRVGLPAVKSVLEGFNSTIFAYGQTGSGKTFTITGGPEKYADRGIIPRSISYLFNEFQLLKDRDNRTFTCYVSYMEIYNENGFDLLKKTVDYAFSHDIPKVNMLEDEEGQLHFRNLSIHKVDSEEDALNLLFLGDTNRAIGETAMNQASSRSHCIFTLMIECRKGKSDTLVRSKLNLVDLAGSERVHKTNSAGQTLKEAQYINQSLFFLEMVIVALHEKSSKGDSIHIPYRNSMMTSVLRDSLGGNCKTIMIATMSPERDQTDESISTCHFAQRVALVKNQAYVNEEIQPEFVIQRLKHEISRLREEIRFLKGEDEDDDFLSLDRLKKLEKSILDYIEDENDESKLDVGKKSFAAIHVAFSVFKKIVKERRKASDASFVDDDIVTNDSLSTIAAECTSGDYRHQVLSLKKTLKQRDKEIAILVDMVKNGRPLDINYYCDSDNVDRELPQESVNESDYCSPEILNDAAAAFSWFRSKYPGEANIQEDKELLKVHVAEAKSIGENIKKTKEIIQDHMSTIEQLRRATAINQLYQNVGTPAINSNEDYHREAIEKEKNSYSEFIARLKQLKSMIEGIQATIEKKQAKMQTSFDNWYTRICRRQALSVTSAQNSDHEKKDLTVEIEPRMKKAESPNREAIQVESQVNPEDVEIPPGVVLTGDQQTDDDIIAFYRAKRMLLSRTSGNIIHV